jgi:hypothetical protein
MKVFFAAAIAAASFFALNTMSAKAEAQAFFNFPMRFAGTGCGAGSVSFSGQGTDTLTVLFSKYDAAKPRNKAASNMERTACSFVIPVQVKPGFQVSTMTADWRGYSEGNGELFREYFFAGSHGPRRTTSPKGNYTEHDDLMHTIWSGCNGDTVPMRINSSVRAVSSPSYIAVDTLDLQNKIVFHLQWRKCR